MILFSPMADTMSELCLNYQQPTGNKDSISHTKTYQHYDGEIINKSIINIITDI